jgi:hypothetical protein
VVHDVVEVGGEVVDVLPVERRHERRVDRPHDLVGDLVTDVLGVAHPGGDAGALVGRGTEQLLEQLDAGDEVVAERVKRS